MPLQPGFKIVKQSSIEAAKEQIKQLKREKAELKTQLETKDEEKERKAEILLINKAADEAIAHGKKKIAQQDVIIAELHESSDNARRAFVELQLKHDEATMPLYAQRLRDDEINDAIAKELREAEEKSEVGDESAVLFDEEQLDM